MRVRFWGTRGSIAAPGSATVRYGGNTPCVEVRTDDGTLLIFDCGTGAPALGLALGRTAAGRNVTRAPTPRPRAPGGQGAPEAEQRGG